VHVDEQVQEVLFEVLVAIKTDRIRYPELLAFVRDIAARKSAGFIGAGVQERSHTREDRYDTLAPISPCTERLRGE
jgi:hypothetical protein